MKKFIKEQLNLYLSESVTLDRIDDIDDDETYDNLLHQVDNLSKSGEIGFGSAEPFGVLYGSKQNQLIGATWLESSGNFTFHIVIKPEFRGKGYSKYLLDDLMKKYDQMKSYMGDDYKVVVNVVNDGLSNTLLKHYGFKKVQDNGHGGEIMSN